MGQKVLDLTGIEPERLRSAISAIIEGQAGSVAAGSGEPGSLVPEAGRFRDAASAAHSAVEDDRARYFQSILEVGYLVASADGFAEDERGALSDLLEQVTGRSVTHEELELHFKDLDDACSMLGRRERLRRAAADFDDSLDRRQALAFATLVAASDGELGETEHATLIELGQWFELDGDAVRDLISKVEKAIEAALSGGGRA